MDSDYISGLLYFTFSIRTFIIARSHINSYRSNGYYSASTSDQTEREGKLDIKMGRNY
ncbi:hypothetical protein BMS3Abin04_02795 [bacterium BMS3Abin04]|nr:hypothetical protein BMS3Abin04_02795 [bacterium BMS3Abin04]